MALPLDAVTSENGITFIPARYHAGLRAKRVLDVAGALTGLLMIAPLFLLLMTLVKFSDGGKIFYGHKRIGRFGREFRCFKFRTMVLNGDAVLDKHLASNPAARDEWLATRKLQQDPRVTPVGAVLRKLSLDELPQLFNILTGEMSIVGPRPVVRDELSLYGRHAQFYLASKPGLTGLWQISGRNDVGYDERVAFDRQYIENWSFKTDLVIIAKTIPAVCLSQGSY